VLKKDDFLRMMRQEEPQLMKDERTVPSWLERIFCWVAGHDEDHRFGTCLYCGKRLR
jgi:hypothetical protein